ncbi:hypothetical protein DPMN_114665 [Dreissena polymorpha]|uniref:Uncharacterized protein n=1 Tax=Dreissena polymorpha TaxID=45954 RepID=A0A9D4KJX3_DREPO|nr:hypothetical protein DPMN_114665 [Dreissena polymorpha]
MIEQKFHVIQLTGTIFELNSLFKCSRVFTCFHYIHIEKNAPPTGSHINKTNVLTNFHDDWAKIVTSRVFTSHVIQLTGTIFELNSHIKETNVLTKFQENLAKNVTSKVEKCPDHLRPYINKTNVLTNFHDDWAKIVTSRVFTRKTAPPLGSHVIQLTGTIFELNSHIKETNVLIKCQENWAKNVTSRVEKCPDHWRPYINKTNVLTNFHDDWAKIVTSRLFTRNTAPPRLAAIEKCPAHWRPCFFTDLDHFELVPDINKTNVLTNFHDDWAKIVTSRVFTMKTAPPTGGHVFQRTGITFELDKHIIKANILTKLHEDWA